eukprot:632302-Amphidinium_carterae.1
MLCQHPRWELLAKYKVRSQELSAFGIKKRTSPFPPRAHTHTQTGELHASFESARFAPEGLGKGKIFKTSQASSETKLQLIPEAMEILNLDACDSYSQ